jgi:cytochrome bd ubiquinol oxidase subunit II
MMAGTVGAILLASVALYGVLGGADFGGGLWDLLAGTTARGRQPRALIEESITPVWEGNHVWLVFDLVIFWTAFPHAFTAVMSTLALPLWLAVGGVVLRGAGFAFRKEITLPSLQRITGATFAFSSLLTPFFMGTVVGAIAAGAVPGGATRASLSAWTSPTALLAGFLFVAACGYLAAVYLTGEAAGRGDHVMQAYFTRRAQAAAIAAGALSLAALFELQNSNPVVYGRLTGRALPLIVLAGACGLAVLGLLTAGRPRGIRPIAALGVAAVVWGWGVAQYPVLLPGTAVTLTNAGAPPGSFVSIVVIAVAAVILVVPSFALLFALQGRRLLDHDHPGPLPEAVAAGAGSGSGAPAWPSRIHEPLARLRQRAQPRASGTRDVLGLLAIAATIRRRSRRLRRPSSQTPDE